MKNHQESRQWLRQPIRQTVGLELTTTDSGRMQNTVQQGLGVDLSPGGIGLLTPYPLKGGEVIKLMFPVTEGEMRLPVFTEVMWVQPASGGNRAGLRFLV